MLNDGGMKTKLVLIGLLFLSGCSAATWDRIAVAIGDSHSGGYSPQMPDYSRPQNIVDPLEQRGSSMSFMCRDAVNRRDSGGAFIFC